MRRGQGARLRVRAFAAAACRRKASRQDVRYLCLRRQPRQAYGHSARLRLRCGHAGRRVLSVRQVARTFRRGLFREGEGIRIVARPRRRLRLRGVCADRLLCFPADDRALRSRLPCACRKLRPALTALCRAVRPEATVSYISFVFVSLCYVLFVRIYQMGNYATIRNLC